MSYNATKLMGELLAAGISDAVSCNSDGKVHDAAVNEITARAGVQAVLAAHNPAPTRAQRLAAKGMTPLQAAILLVLHKRLTAPAWARALVAAEGDKLAAEEP